MRGRYTDSAEIDFSTQISKLIDAIVITLKYKKLNFLKFTFSEAIEFGIV